MTTTFTNLALASLYKNNQSHNNLWQTKLIRSPHGKHTQLHNRRFLLILRPKQFRLTDTFAAGTSATVCLFFVPWSLPVRDEGRSQSDDQQSCHICKEDADEL